MRTTQIIPHHDNIDIEIGDDGFISLTQRFADGSGTESVSLHVMFVDVICDALQKAKASFSEEEGSV